VLLTIIVVAVVMVLGAVAIAAVLMVLTPLVAAAVHWARSRTPTRSP